MVKILLEILNTTNSSLILLKNSFLKTEGNKKNFCVQDKQVGLASSLDMITGNIHFQHYHFQSSDKCPKQQIQDARAIQTANTLELPDSMHNTKPELLHKFSHKP
jgi:hypothetical protein